MTDTVVTIDAIHQRNRQVVDAHLDKELHNLDAAMDLYTDDIVWESPARGVVLRGREQIKAQYRDLFESLTIHSTVRLRQVVTDEWVFNDNLMSVTVTGDRLPGLSYPVGTELTVRQLGAFQIRDGRICREVSHEGWRPAGDLREQADIPADAQTIHRDA